MSISEDKWLLNGELASCKEGCSILSVQDLIDQNVHSWNLSSLRENLNPSSAIEALKTPISLTNQRDGFFWPHTSDDIYSVKYGFHLS